MPTIEVDENDSVPAKSYVPGLVIFDKMLEYFAVLIGGCLLAYITALSVVNVLVMRKMFSAPIQGAEDTLILALIALVAVAIPFGARAGAHIEIEIVTDMIGPHTTRISLILTRLLSVAFISMMTWRLWDAGTKAVQFGEVTQQLELSYEYFYYGLSLCFALFALAQIFDIAQLIFRGEIVNITEKKDVSS